MHHHNMHLMNSQINSGLISNFVSRLDQYMHFYYSRYGRHPEHIVELVLPGVYYPPGLFVLDHSKTPQDTVRIGTTSMEDVMRMDDGARRKIIAQFLMDRQPETLYRFGDIVIIADAMAETGDVDLWHFVVAPDPVYNTCGPDAVVALGRFGGRMQTVQVKELGELVLEQNALREKHGLPAIGELTHIVGD
jgi:hypothetical protein